MWKEIIITMAVTSILIVFWAGQLNEATKNYQEQQHNLKVQQDNLRTQS